MAVEDAALAALVGPAVARMGARWGTAEQNKFALSLAVKESRDDVLAGLVRTFRPDWVNMFAKTNKVVEHPIDKQPVVAPRVPDLDLVPLDQMGREGQEALEKSRQADLRVQARRRRGKSAKKKVYTLDDLFYDTAVCSKFGMTTAELQVVKRTATLDPAAACRNLSQRLQQAGHDCTVTPGNYAKGKRSARGKLHAAVDAAYVPPPDVDMVAIGDQVIVEGPKGRNGRPLWSCSGETRVAPEVIACARLALLHGVVTVRHVFEELMMTCGVTLVEEGIIVGDVEYHYGDPTKPIEGIAGTDGSSLLPAVRAAGNRILPLVQGGCVVATAVRVTPGTSYANWHVIERGASYSAPVALKYTDAQSGVVKQCPVSSLHEVAADIWMVEHEVSAYSEGAWVPREADVGESCVLVYAGMSGPEFSGTIEVVRKEAGSVVTTRPLQARMGVSGAALVALSDGALLGIYRGAAFDLCSCAVVGLGGYDIQTMDASEVNLYSPAIAAAPDESQADSVYEQFQRRGLADTLAAALSSLKPLYVRGQHVAYTVRHGEMTYTPLDCDVWPVTDTEARSLAFERVEGDRFRARALEGQPPLRQIRLPRANEKVYVVGSDTQGAYFSRPLVINRLSTDHMSFWLSGDPAEGSPDEFVYAGALIVADTDGAVVGQFHTAMVTGVGKLSKCAGFVSRVLAPTAGRASALNALSPAVLAELWDPKMVSGLLDLDPQTVGEYASVGSQVIQSAVVVHLRRAGEDPSAAVSVVSDTSWIGARAFDCGFHQFVRARSNVGFRPTDRLADAFRAFLGMLAVAQDQQAVSDTLEHLGWFSFEWSEEADGMARHGRSPYLTQGGWGSRPDSPASVIGTVR